MSIVHSRADVAAVVDAMPLLVGRLRDLSIDSRGVVDPSTGERRSGLVVVGGVHPRPGSRYRIVTQRPARLGVADARLLGFRRTPLPQPGMSTPGATTSEIELRANDRRTLAIAMRIDNPALHELTAAMHDPEGLGAIEVQSVREVNTSWLLGGKLTVDGTADLAQIRSADNGSSAAAMRLRHRRLAASATLTSSEADARSIRLTIDATVRGRGMARPLVAIASVIWAGKIRRAVAKNTDAAMADWRKRRMVAGEFDASTIADSLLADWLSLVVPAVVTDSSGPLPR